MFSDQDGAEPSANSVSAMNLLRLSQILDQPDWRQKAVTIFRAFSERLEKIPLALPEMVSALMFYQSPAKQVRGIRWGGVGWGGVGWVWLRVVVLCCCTILSDL